MSCLLFFLWNAVTLDFFHMEGKITVLIQLLKSINRGFDNVESQIFIILIDLSTSPPVFFTFKALTTFMKSWSSKTTDDSLPLVTKEVRLWYSLLSLMDVHWRLNYLLHLLPFSSNSNTSSPFTRTVSITGIFLPLKNLFSIEQ